jgi:Flp pilus assembly protein CpaB
MELAQKLISTRRGSLYLALIVAAVAGASILVYLNQYRSNLESGGTPVTVLVARTAIPKGTPGTVIASRHLFTASTIRESQLRDGAMSDTAGLRGMVATADIYEGAQLTAADFATQAKSGATSLSGVERAIAIPLDAAHGLIGEVKEGDHVDVYAGFNVIPLTADGRPASGGQARPVLRLIMADVPVLTVGKATGTSSTTNVSLRVNDRQAAELAFASDNGKVWLSLRPAVGAEGSRPAVVTAETLLLGVSPVTVVHALGGRR